MANGWGQVLNCDVTIQDLTPADPFEGSYATNENAINWNAALVFLLAGAGPTS
jgi:hypothetical protein